MSNDSATIFRKAIFFIKYWNLSIISDYRRAEVESLLIKKATLMEGEIGKTLEKLYIMSKLPTV